MALHDHLEAATLEQAVAWQATDEKFSFCVDLMGISAHSTFSDRWVDELENEFEVILHKHGLLQSEVPDCSPAGEPC